ncbi:MAG: DUF4190 domain-containing protein [Beutenbergiaceae bacterium]
MTSPGFSPLMPPAPPYEPAQLQYTQASEVDSLRANLRTPVDAATFVNAYTRPVPSYAETFAEPGYFTKRQPVSAVAVIALVCGLLSPFLVLTAPVAIVLGHIGLVVTGNNEYQGRGLAIGGLVIGYGFVSVLLLLFAALWLVGQ